MEAANSMGRRNLPSCATLEPEKLLGKERSHIGRTAFLGEKRAQDKKRLPVC